MLKGISVPHRKNTANLKPIEMPSPKYVIIPMAMHIGRPSVPIVKPGEAVQVGQRIADAGGYVGAPIFASVSGTVKKLGDWLVSGGNRVQTVEIESDGQMTPYTGLQVPEVSDYASFINAVAGSGLVGLGGAGFPTHVKLDIKDLSRLDYVIVNGAECEPYITSDTRTMLDREADIQKGLSLLEQYLGAKNIIIGIEKNKPACIETMQRLAAKDSCVTVKVLPSTYPQGGEKVLIYHTVGRIVGEGKLPIDAGCIVINCTTLADLGEYFTTGMPLVKKCVTVDGSAVKEPRNVIVPIGTPMKDVIDFCGGCKEAPAKVLYGGPMMGIAVPDLEQPILKSTNAITLFAEKDAHPPKPTPCIRCGKCVDHCPLNLMPADIERAYEKKDGELLEKLKVNLCMECGCCAFGCPAGRPLVQVNKLAKAELRSFQNKRKEDAEREKARLEAKEAKEAKEKKEAEKK